MYNCSSTIVAVVNKDNSITITATFNDQSGTPRAPVTLNWSLTNISGDIINGRDHVVVDSPTSEFTIILSGEDLALTTQEELKGGADRQFILEGTDDTPDPEFSGTCIFYICSDKVIVTINSPVNLVGGKYSIYHLAGYGFSDATPLEDSGGVGQVGISITSQYKFLVDYKNYNVDGHTPNTPISCILKWGYPGQVIPWVYEFVIDGNNISMDLTPVADNSYKVT